MKPKGCFVTFGLHELDDTKFKGEVGSALFPMTYPQIPDRDGDEEMKAGEEPEVKQDKLQGDRYFCLGGWRPYINLAEIELLVSPAKKKEHDIEDQVDLSELVSLDDYMAGECMKREASLMADSPVKISECDEGVSPDRIKEGDFGLGTTPVRQTEPDS